jgi:hypothetical protein
MEGILFFIFGLSTGVGLVTVGSQTAARRQHKDSLWAQAAAYRLGHFHGKIGHHYDPPTNLPRVPQYSPATDRHSAVNS